MAGGIFDLTLDASIRNVRNGVLGTFVLSVVASVPANWLTHRL
jgi:hypothetical protein